MGENVKNVFYHQQINIQERIKFCTVSMGIFLTTKTNYIKTKYIQIIYFIIKCRGVLGFYRVYLEDSGREMGSVQHNIS